MGAELDWRIGRYSLLQRRNSTARCSVRSRRQRQILTLLPSKTALQKEVASLTIKPVDPKGPTRICAGRHMLIQTALFFLILTVPLLASDAQYQVSRPGMEFQIFHFPRDAMPRIDGQTDDWKMVPERYAYDISLLKDTEYGLDTEFSKSSSTAICPEEI